AVHEAARQARPGAGPAAGDRGPGDLADVPARRLHPQRAGPPRRDLPSPRLGALGEARGGGPGLDPVRDRGRGHRPPPHATDRGTARPGGVTPAGHTRGASRWTPSVRLSTSTSASAVVANPTMPPRPAPSSDRAVPCGSAGS